AFAGGFTFRDLDPANDGSGKPSRSKRRQDGARRVRERLHEIVPIWVEKRPGWGFSKSSANLADDRRSAPLSGDATPRHGTHVDTKSVRTRPLTIRFNNVARNSFHGVASSVSVVECPCARIIIAAFSIALGSSASTMSTTSNRPSVA